MVIRHYEKNGTGDALFAVEFGHSVIREREKKIGPRVRDTDLLHFVTAGEGVFCGKPVARGDVFFIARDKLHEFTVFLGYAHFWVAFDGDGARALLSAFSVDPSVHGIFHVREDDMAFLTDRVQALFDRGGRECALAALSEILSFREMPRDEAGKKSDAARAAAYLADNLYKHLTMRELAAYVNLSEHYLCRVFKREYGMPPQKLLVKLRMEKAAAMLAGTDFLVKSVALSVGYPSQLAFSEMFRRFSGVSPTEYRKNAGAH